MPLLLNTETIHVTEWSKKILTSLMTKVDESHFIANKKRPDGNQDAKIITHKKNNTRKEF